MTEQQKQDFALRLAGTGDLPALVGFNRAMARETEGRELDVETLKAGVRALLEDERHGFYVVAEGGGEVVGSLLVTYEWSDWRNGVFWWVQSVYVKPAFRRRGVYRRLYRFVKARAAERGGVRGFRLYVEKHNEVAQRTYKQLGMSETHYKMYEELSEP